MSLLKTTSHHIFTLTHEASERERERERKRERERGEREREREKGEKKLLKKPYNTRVEVFLTTLK